MARAARSMCRAAWSASERPTGTPATPRTCVSLHHRGHEIGCHTFSHLRACDLDEPSLADEIARNRAYFRSLDSSIEIRTFAYPFGYGSFAPQAAAQGRVPDLPQHRSGHQPRQRGLAVPSRDAADRSPDEIATGSSARSTRRKSNNGWLIFYGHDVAGTAEPLWLLAGTRSITPSRRRRRRKIPALTMAEAMRCARV